MQITKELFDKLSELTQSMLDERGFELPNPVPIQKSLKIKRPPTLQEQIRRIIKTDLSNQAMSQGFETFDQANDFDIDEDPLPTSQYEAQDMIAEEPRTVKKEISKEIIDEAVKKIRDKLKKEDINVDEITDEAIKLQLTSGE